jgi:hypothetical protein
VRFGATSKWPILGVAWMLLHVANFRECVF